MAAATTNKRRRLTRKPRIKTYIARVATLCDSFFMLSIDVGTSGVRAALFDERGVETTSRQATRRNDGALSDLGEFDPHGLVDEVITTIDELLVSSLQAAPIEFIAISTFWHSLVGVDANGNATTPLLSWADTRAAQVAKTLRASFDET